MQNEADINKLKIRSKSTELLNLRERMRRRSTCWCVRIGVCFHYVSGGE